MNKMTQGKKWVQKQQEIIKQHFSHSKSDVPIDVLHLVNMDHSLRFLIYIEFGFKVDSDHINNN